MSMYGRGLLEATAGRTDTWLLRYDDGTAEPLMLGRWCGSLVAGDHGLLDRCAAPTLDVGCGPGRLAAAVAWRGMPVLGVDISPAAVGMARARGVSALCRSVFDGLPGEGRWQTALLADGNVGIGGDPVRLLSRLRSLLAPLGVILCELDPPDTVTRVARVSIEDPHGVRSQEFGWARVSVADIATMGRESALLPVDIWQDAGRWFAALVR